MCTEQSQGLWGAGQGNSLGPLPQQIHSTTQELPTGALQGLTRVPSRRCNLRLAFLGSEAQGGGAGALRATPGIGVMLRVTSGRTQDPGCRSRPTYTGSPGGNRQVRDNLVHVPAGALASASWPSASAWGRQLDSQRVPPATSCEVSTHACVLEGPPLIQVLHRGPTAGSWPGHTTGEEQVWGSSLGL